MQVLGPLSLSFCVRISIDLVLFQVLFKLLHCWGIMDTVSLLFPGDRISQQTSWSSGSKNISALCLGMFPEPDVQECLSYHITTNKKHIQKQLWEEKVYFILYFHVTVHPMEIGTGIQERKLEAETETMEECCLLVCFPPHGFFTLLC